MIIVPCRTLVRLKKVKVKVDSDKLFIGAVMLLFMLLGHLPNGHLPERSFARRTCVYIYIIFTQVGNNRYITPKISCINFK